MNSANGAPMRQVRITINGETHDLLVAPHTTLLDLVREELNLTGTKEGCSEGDCGACTMLLGDRAVPSCLVLATDAHGQAVTTIEGLASGEGLTALQQAFVEQDAVQCGYCTPGMILSAEALLRAKPQPTRPEVQHALAGNLCRCTGYVRIINAVMAAAERRSAANPAQTAGPTQAAAPPSSQRGQ